MTVPPAGPPPGPPSGPYPPPVAMGPVNSGKAVAVLVLGIVGLVLTCSAWFGFVLAIVALALAPGARREIAASQGRLTGESFIKAGVICSWVSIGLAVVAVLALIALFVLGIAFSTTTTLEENTFDIQSLGAWVRQVR